MAKKLPSRTTKTYSRRIRALANDIQFSLTADTGRLVEAVIAKREPEAPPFMVEDAIRAAMDGLDEIIRFNLEDLERHRSRKAALEQLLARRRPQLTLVKS